MAPNIKKRVLVGTPMFAALIGLFLLDSVAAQHGLGGLPPAAAPLLPGPLPKLGLLCRVLQCSQGHSALRQCRVVWHPQRYGLGMRGTRRQASRAL